MEVTVENLESAVSQFYHSDSVLQAQAHQWLTSIQSSPNAWGFVWDLLQPNRSKEGQFFAATTLHMKIMKNWSQVPPEQYGNLKNKLLETIVQYSTGPELILNRLCIALSALLIQMTPRYWDESIGDLLSMFRPENLPTLPPHRVIWILLEVLTFIPEEFQTMTLSSTHKSYVRNELEKNADKVMSLIESSLGVEEVGEVAVKAAAAWLQLGVSLPVCMNIAGSLVSVVRSKFSDITETCEHELEALNQMMTHPDSHKYPSYILQMLPPLLQLVTDIKASGNDEALTNSYKILIGVGETHTRLLLSALKSPENSAKAQGLVSHLLDCTASPGDYPKDETRSQLVFSFWYLLQRPRKPGDVHIRFKELHLKKQHLKKQRLTSCRVGGTIVVCNLLKDEMINLDKDDMEFVSAYLVPVYEKLCEVLLHKSKLPNDIDNLSSADQELIRIYRQDIADTIVYCYYMAREHLVNLLVRWQREVRSWQEAEAVLHVVLALAETATAQDDETVIGLLVNTPPAYLRHHKVVNSLNQAAGAYAEWLGDALEQLIPGLVASLQSPETATSATMALKDITRERTASLEPYAPGLLAACQEALNKGHMKNTECVRLMYSVGRLLSVLPYNHMIGSLDPLLANYVTEIERLRDQPQLRSNLILRLRMLSTLCSSLYSLEVGPDPPAFLVLSRILPLLSGVCQACSQDHALIAEVCHFLNVCVVHALPGKPSHNWVLEPIINLGVACYAAQPNKEALDLVKQVSILFGTGNTENTVRQLLVAVTRETVHQSRTLAPEVLQAYFNLLTSIVKKVNTLLTTSIDLQHIINFGTDSLLVAEVPTVKAAGTFLSILANASAEKPAFATPIRAVGHHLVATVVHCIAGQTPRSGLDIFSDILLTLNKRFPENLTDWLRGGLSQLPSLQESQKDHFCKMVVREKVNKKKLAEIIKEFSLISRGLVTTDFEH